MNQRQELLSGVEAILGNNESIDHFPEEFKPDFLRQCLKIDMIRSRLVQARLIEAKNKKLFKFFTDTTDVKVLKSGKSTIEHNLQGVFNDVSSARSARLVRPLSVIEYQRPLSLLHRNNGAMSDIDVETDSKVLCIGPRNEAEILMLWSYGFKLENIVGLDLISYSPLIDLGDMHSLPYENDSFDVVVSSCTFAYSTNIMKAIAEIKRVIRPNGIVAVMSHASSAEHIQLINTTVGADIMTKNSIAHLFYGSSGADILYSNFVEDNLRSKNGTSSSCIFRKKQTDILSL